MGMEVGGVGGYGAANLQLNKIVQELGETNKIVIDIFKELNEFKATTDKAIVKDKVIKAEETVEKLRAQIKMMAPMMNGSLQKLEQMIQDLKQQLGM